MGAGHVQVDIRLKQRREGNYRDFCGTPFCRQSVSEHKTVEGRRVLHTPLSVHIGELLYMSEIHQISSSYIKLYSGMLLGVSRGAVDSEMLEGALGSPDTLAKQTNLSIWLNELVVECSLF